MTTTATTASSDTGQSFTPAATALSAYPRRRRASALGASVAFGWRALLKIKHVPEQLTDVIAIPIVFTVMFTYLFGGALDQSTGTYLHYLLPGTLVMAVVLVTMYSGVNLSTDLTTGAFDRFRSLPIWRGAPIVGGLLGDAGRYLLAAILVVVLGLAMGFRPDGGAPGVLAAVGLVVLFALSLTWVWTVLGLVVRTPTAVMSLGIVVQFPLTLASNTFVRPQTMPGWLQGFVKVNPVSHVVTAARGLMDGTVAADQVLWALLACAGLVVVFAPLALRLYSRGR